MDRSSVVTLIGRTYTVDEIGQRVSEEHPREVFAAVDSVSRDEWAEAGRVGLKAEYRVTMFAPDYEGEALAELDGVRYGVYRTYQGRDETVELYLERKGGV